MVEGFWRSQNHRQFGQADPYSRRRINSCQSVSHRLCLEDITGKGRVVGQVRPVLQNLCDGGAFHSEREPRPECGESIQGVIEVESVE